MKLIKLEQTVSEHSGVFYCIGRGGDKTITKSVNFEHIFDPPVADPTVPDIGMLKEFYSTFGSLTLYHHKESGDAAYYVASPKEWESLFEYFSGWIDDLDEDEQDELLPVWIDDCVVIGEIPHSGNYLLVPTDGEMAGHVFEFEHDGFEFIDRGSNISDFVFNILKPNAIMLNNMVSHMTLAEGNEENQWWVEEMRDNCNNIVKTEV
jgi:hypothetical protein